MDNSVKKKIEFYCVYQERCKMEVTQKLKKLGVFGDDLDDYIHHLTDNNFLNEQRFTECYVRGKFNNNNWGIRVLARKIIDENNSLPKEKIKEKVYNRLEYKGWEKELIFSAINALIN